MTASKQSRREDKAESARPADAQSGRIVTRKSDGIGWMIYDHQPRYNAITYEMRLAIPDIMADYEADETVRVVVLAGAGDKAFISGSDISQFEKQRASEDARQLYDRASERAGAAMAAFPKPMIAMIHGYCLGAGLMTAMYADIRIASGTARFGLPPARLGLGLGYGAVRNLINLVGPAHASEILFTGDRYSAEEARRMGLVNRVVPQAGLDEAVTALAERIVANAPLTLRSLKTSIRNAVADEDKRDMDRVRAEIEACYASEDYIEGRRAFMEKRRPNFSGR